MTLAFPRFLAAAFALVALLLLPPSPASAAANTGGGGGLSFSCDVNTKKCKCTGAWEGADCKAMQPNCDPNGDGTTHSVCDANGCSCFLKKTGSAPANSGTKAPFKAPKKMLSQ